MTTATLGFVVDSSQAESAAADLDKLVASATRTEASVEKLGRSSKKALADAGAGSSEFSRKIQSAIQQTENLGRTFGAQDDHVRAFRDEIERLTNKFQPLVAAEKRHEAALGEIQRAHRLGVISTQQMTQHLDQERLAFERLKTSAATAGAAVKAANANVPRGGAAAGGINPATNSMFQFQDIAMTAAMGMNPAMIGLQQGSQLAGAYAGMSMKQAAASAGAGLVGMLNPLSLVTIGLTTATAAAIQYFMTSSDGTDEMALDLERQRDLIAKVSTQWGDALPALREYADELERAKAGSDLMAGANATNQNTLKTVKTDVEGASIAFGDLVGQLQAAGAESDMILGLQSAFGKFSSAAADGSLKLGDVKNVQDALSSALKGGGIPALQDFSKSFGDLSKAALEASGNVQGTTAAAERAIAMMRKHTSPGTYDGVFRSPDFSTQGSGTILPEIGPTPTPRSSFLSGDQSTALSRLLSGSVDSANDLSVAMTNVATATQAANTGFIDVSHSLAMAKVQQLAALETTAKQVRDMKSELRDIKEALDDASDTPLSDIFTRGQNVAADTVSNAVAGIEKLMLAMKNTGASARQTYDGIELIRSRLKQLGGDTKAVDLLVDSLVAGYRETVRLEGGIKALSQSIMNIPNKVVSIGIQQYTVPSSGGGTKGVNVYGGQADFSYQSYDVGGGKTIGVSGGNGAVLPPRGLVSQSDVDNMLSLQGYRAAGGPVSAGGTYMVGENGPELLTMSGPGQVTNANSTASILSGGRDTLSLIEDHLYDVVQELRIHTNYFETFESDYSEMIACLKAIKTVGSSSSYNGGGSSYSSGSSYSGGSSSDGGQSHLDPYSPYYFNAARNNAGRGGGRYDPIADALMNGNTEALRNLSGGPTAAISRALAGHNMPSLLDRLKKQAGFATGGQIMPGEEQKVEFFKRRKERVIIVDNDNVSDQRGASQQAAPQALPPIQITNYFQGDVGDARSRQSMEDQFRRAVQQAIRR